MLENEQVETQNGNTPGDTKSNASSICVPNLPERFEFLEKLGQGGMGVVYKARNKYTNTMVAIKMMSNAERDSSALDRFKREAQAASSFTHPNAVKILDFGVHEQTPYLVMEFADGISLDSLLHQRTTLDEPTALSIGMSVCEALIEAHKAGVIHRDLKPSNIMLVHDGGEHATAKVLDFGLAKLTNLSASQQLTRTGDIVGTPLYMSPEQFQGRPADARSDIYSLGAVLYQCMTGRPPHEGESAFATMYKRMNERPKPISTHKKHSNFEQLIIKCLEREPEDRYQDTAQLLADLQRAAAGKRIKISRRTFKAHSKFTLTPVAAAGILLFVVALCGITGFFLNYHEDLTPSKPETLHGKSIADLNKQIEQHPNSADAYFQRGVFHYIREERNNAVDDFTTALELDPKFAEAYPYRAEMYLLLSQPDKALADIDKAIALFPTWCDAHARRARIELYTEQYHQSIADAMKALSISYYDLAAMTLTQDYDALGDMGKALYCANYAVHKGPADTLFWAYQTRASVYVDANQLDAAESDLQAAIKMKPKDSFIWGLQAQVYARRGDMQKAEYAIKRTLAFDLFPARAHRLEGEMLRAAGQWQNAAEAYSASTSLEPTYAPAYTQRAIAEFSLGEFRSAKLDLEKTIGLCPTSALANSYLAVVDDQLKDDQAAQKCLNAAFDQTANLPINFVNRARIGLNHNDLASALENCNLAIAHNPFCADAYATRSLVLNKMSAADEAAKDIDTARRLGWHVLAFDPAANTHAVPRPAHLQVSRPDVSQLVADSSFTLPDRTTAIQRWALASAAILTEQPDWQQFPDHDELALWPCAPHFIRQSRERLKQWDGVTGSQGLKHLLDSMMREAALSNKQTKAFDYVRLIARCRIGYVAGYLTSQEAWDYILPAAVAINSNFKSWSDLADSYVAARSDHHLGAAYHGRDFEIAARKIADRLTKTVPFAKPPSK